MPSRGLEQLEIIGIAVGGGVVFILLVGLMIKCCCCKNASGGMACCKRGDNERGGCCKRTRSRSGGSCFTKIFCCCGSGNGCCKKKKKKKGGGGGGASGGRGLDANRSGSNLVPKKGQSINIGSFADYGAGAADSPTLMQVGSSLYDNSDVGGSASDGGGTAGGSSGGPTSTPQRWNARGSINGKSYRNDNHLPHTEEPVVMEGEYTYDDADDGGGDYMHVGEGDRSSGSGSGGHNSYGSAEDGGSKRRTPIDMHEIQESFGGFGDDSLYSDDGSTAPPTPTAAPIAQLPPMASPRSGASSPMPPHAAPPLPAAAAGSSRNLVVETHGGSIGFLVENCSNILPGSEGVCIVDIAPSSPAALLDDLNVGDILVAINETSLTGMGAKQCIQVLKEVNQNGHFVLTVMSNSTLTMAVKRSSVAFHAPPPPPPPPMEAAHHHMPAPPPGLPPPPPPSATVTGHLAAPPPGPPPQGPPGGLLAGLAGLGILQQQHSPQPPPGPPPQSPPPSAAVSNDTGGAVEDLDESFV